MNTKPRKRPLLALADGTQLIRLIPALAEEIGLQKALVLPQVAFWIGRSKVYRDGRYWARLSVRWMQKNAFSFWAISTINRWITRLVEEGYLVEGNYGTHPHDLARWLALNPEGFDRLKSVGIIWETESPNDTPPDRNEISAFPDRTSTSQNETNQESESRDLSKDDHRDSSDDDLDLEDKRSSLRTQLDPSGSFGPMSASMIVDLQTQLERLGGKTAQVVLTRCRTNGGRTWAYLLKALTNEQTPTQPLPPIPFTEPETPSDADDDELRARYDTWKESLRPGQPPTAKQIGAWKTAFGSRYPNSELIAVDNGTWIIALPQSLRVSYANGEADRLIKHLSICDVPPVAVRFQAYPPHWRLSFQEWRYTPALQKSVIQKAA